MSTTGSSGAPRGLALYLVSRDVGAMCDWLVGSLGFEETGRYAGADGAVTNAELLAGSTVLLLEKGDLDAAAYPRGVRWTGVWVDDPDGWYGRLVGLGVDADAPIDEPWGVRLVRVVDPEGHTWALIKRSAP
jgi:uncharacterized glyoxalase superfamily protein PhnB